MMPSSSAKQHKFMEAIAHNKAFAKKVGVSQNVGKDFSEADKGKKFGRGGVSRPDLEKLNSAKTRHGEMALMKKGGIMKSEKASEMRQAKTLEKLAKEERAEAKGMKRGGHTKKMASGGMTTGKHGISEKSGLTTAKMGKAEVGGKLKHGEHSIQKKGHTRAMEPKMGAGKPLGMKRGGKAC